MFFRLTQKVSPSLRLDIVCFEHEKQKSQWG